MSSLGVARVGKILPPRINIKNNHKILAIKNIISTERIHLRIKRYYLAKIIFKHIISLIYIYCILTYHTFIKNNA